MGQSCVQLQLMKGELNRGDNASHHSCMTSRIRQSIAAGMSLGGWHAAWLPLGPVPLLLLHVLAGRLGSSMAPHSLPSPGPRVC